MDFQKANFKTNKYIKHWELEMLIFEAFTVVFWVMTSCILIHTHGCVAKISTVMVTPQIRNYRTHHQWHNLQNNRSFLLENKLKICIH